MEMEMENYPVHRIVAFGCAECGDTFHQPDDSENRLCLNCEEED